ncbi:MAG: glucuronate isomerase [Chitinophagaceae bacterium]|nr:glucuronate isomerase [Chitinophagaceae bacterium]
MRPFLDDDFLLNNETAKALYHQYAKDLPIIDYHNHLSPEAIAQDVNYENITQLWLNGDHYKWRAMRANGVDESYITGNRSDREKFEQWARTVPYTLRNPLFHWTHLELRRYFGITEQLNEKTANSIYDQINALLSSKEYSVTGLLEKMNVRLLCTTDDPIDSLAHHQTIRQQDSPIRVLPAFRPDKAMEVEDASQFNSYLQKLEAAADASIGTYGDFLKALKKRHAFFVANGCSVSDHGLESIVAEDYREQEIVAIFQQIRNGKNLSREEKDKFRSAMLIQFAEWDWEKGFVQQYHLGAMRNNNTRRLRELGADSGWDSIGDFSQARALSKFLNKLDSNNTLTKTILYNLNPADNEVFATMIGNFNDGSIAGKIQWGSGWWFLDQKDGMTRQLNTLSNMGLLSRFVGMLTDSRSFLSFPRHEYFRRILCNLLGEDVEKGELPDDMHWIGKIVQDICYHNTRNYFNWQELTPNN